MVMPVCLGICNVMVCRADKSACLCKHQLPCFAGGQGNSNALKCCAP